MEQHHPTLRRVAAGTLAAVMLVGCAGVTAFAAEDDAFTLGIYSTTDMHGKCYGGHRHEGRACGHGRHHSHRQR